MTSVLLMLLLATLLGILTAWLGTRWSSGLMRDAILAYEGQAQRPSFQGTKPWFALWFGLSVLGLMVLQAEGSLSLTAAVFWVGWLALLGLLGLIDAATGLLPNELTLLLMLSGLVWHAFGHVTGLPGADYAWGMVLGWSIPYALNRLHESWRGTLAMGEGDAKFLAGIGAWLGWQALPMVWVCASVAVLVYTALVWLTGHGRPLYVTFGPFLAMGASVVMLLSHV